MWFIDGKIIAMSGLQESSKVSGRGWPTEGIPEEYLLLATRLVHRSFITKVEFVDLCKLAVKYINTGQTSVHSRAGMFLYITYLSLGHDNIDDDTITGRIGDFAADWERDGALDLQSEQGAGRWNDFESVVAEAAKKYKHEDIRDHRKDIPVEFLNAADRILHKKVLAAHEFIDICNLAVKIMEADGATLLARKNIAFFITEIAAQHDEFSDDEPLREIISRFSTYELPDAFNFDFILEKHTWEGLKWWLSHAAENTKRGM
jgi:hypothetical protein